MLRVKETLLDCEVLEFVPPRGSPALIKFNKDGSIEGGDLTRWTLGDDNGRPILTLFDSEKPITVMRMERSYWKGRDRESNGYCILRPMPVDEGKWFQLIKEINTKGLREKQGTGWEALLKDFRFESEFNFVPHERDIDIVARKEHEVAVAIAAADRPEYFGKVAESLAANADITDYDIYLFLDKPLSRSRAAENALAEQISMFSKAFPLCNRMLIRRTANLGCGRNIIDMRRQMFDVMGYDKAFIFEDDTVVSRQYLASMRRLMDYCDENFVNVGAVQGWNPCLHEAREKAEHLGRIEGVHCNWWAYLLKKECWDDIKSTLYFFRDTFLRNYDYAKRPHAIIREWLRKDVQKKPVTRREGFLFPVHMKWHRDREHHLNNIPGGQDGVTHTAFSQGGWVRVAPQINEAVYIGATGIHMSPQRFRNAGFDKMSLDEFDFLDVEYRPSDPLPRPVFKDANLGLMEGFVHMRSR